VTEQGVSCPIQVTISDSCHHHRPLAGARISFHNSRPTCDSRREADVVDGVMTSDFGGHLAVIGGGDRRRQISCIHTSEWVSNFLTAHQDILGYSVPYDGENVIKMRRYNQAYLATINMR